MQFAELRTARHGVNKQILIKQDRFSFKDPGYGIMISSTPETPQKPEVPHLKILVVDDDELNRRMMNILLTREGHQIDVASNGMEALDAVKYEKFDIVFMDLQMPTMDGVEASRRIREWENGGTHTFIVALTASYLPEQGHLLFEAGIDNYISKPFEVEHIQRLLHLISQTPELIPASSSHGAAEQPAVNEVLDIQKGIERVGGEAETYRELLRDFIQDLANRISILESHLLERNMDALSRAAHNLKGVSSNLGAMELAECASELDKQSNEGYTHRHEELFLDLKKAESNLIRTANNFLDKKESIVAQS
jgi:two-component system, sensor histidine kinase and response regulator